MKEGERERGSVQRKNLGEVVGEDEEGKEEEEEKHGGGGGYPHTTDLGAGRG